MNRRELLYFSLFASLVFLLAVTVVASAWYALPRQPESQVTLSIDDYPPGDKPTLVESGDFWLVHPPDGNLLAFVRVAPEYAAHVAVEECRYDWNVANGRFIDPCSGDEWELDGRLSLRHSGELWSSRDLDQYAVTVGEGTITVYLDRIIEGMSRTASHGD